MKMIQILILTLGLTSAPLAASTPTPAPTVGIVNFSQCLTNSKLGKQEQSSFENVKKQLTALLEDTEKQLNELAAKFNNSEYMDGLSPEAEDELKNKLRTLNEEMNRHQNQYYDVLNKANMKMMHTLGTQIQQASERIAKEKHLTMVINKEACFFYTPTLDVTTLIIADMDKNFEADLAKKQQPVAKAEPVPAKSKS